MFHESSKTLLFTEFLCGFDLLNSIIVCKDYEKEYRGRILSTTLTIPSDDEVCSIRTEFLVEKRIGEDSPWQIYQTGPPIFNIPQSTQVDEFLEQESGPKTFLYHRFEVDILGGFEIYPKNSRIGIPDMRKVIGFEFWLARRKRQAYELRIAKKLESLRRKPRTLG